MDEVEQFRTTYKDNPYLPDVMIKEIEALEHKNPKYYKIYGLGEYAPNEKAVFNNFQILEEIACTRVSRIWHGLWILSRPNNFDCSTQTPRYVVL